MSLPIDMTGKFPIVGGDANVYGEKLNANDQELADGINELYDDILEIRGASTGLGLKLDKDGYSGTAQDLKDSIDLKQNITDIGLNTTNKTIVGAINEHELDIISNTQSILTLNTNKLEKGTYTGTAQDLNTAINNIGNSSPKGVYATLVALQTAFPTGTTGIYVVTADGNWYYWSGSAWTSGGLYQSTGIADNSISTEKIKNSAVTKEKLYGEYIEEIECKNIYDKDSALDQKIMQFNPSLGAGTYSGGMLSGIFEVKVGSTYTITQKTREVGAIFCFSTMPIFPYNTNYVCASPSYGSYPTDAGRVERTNYTYSDKFITKIKILDSNIKYMIFHMHGFSYFEEHTVTDFNNINNTVQVELGIVSTEYVLPTNGVQYNIISDKINMKDTNYNFKILKDSENIFVRCEFDDANDIVNHFIFENKNANNFLNLSGVYTVPKENSYNFLDGIIYKNSNDDIAPVNINNIGYVGASHGLNIIKELTVSSHDKTISDVGSVWSINGLNFILLKVINSTKLQFISDFTGNDSAPFNALPSTGTLIHVEGATNLNAVIFSASKTLQLYPNVNNKRISFIFDDNEISENGLYRCNNFKLIERYSIIKPSSLQNFLKNNIGIIVDYADESLSSMIDVVNIYEFCVHGAISVATSYYFNTRLSINYLGGVQSQSIGNLAYVPDMGITDGKNMQDVITQGSNNLDLLKVNWISQDKAPYRFHQFYDSDKGFALGYNTEIGYGKNSFRKNYASSGFFYGATKKMYPFAIYYTNSNINDCVNFVSFRAPILKRDSDLTCFYYYKLNNEYFVFLDSHVNIDKKIELPYFLQNKKITVLDSLNSTIKSDFATTYIPLKIINNFGYAVLKLF